MQGELSGAYDREPLGKGVFDATAIGEAGLAFAVAAHLETTPLANDQASAKERTQEDEIQFLAANLTPRNICLYNQVGGQRSQDASYAE